MREHGDGQDEEEHEPQPGCGGEAAGQPAANCAAVCCCCPMALLEVVLLVAVRLPTDLIDRVRRRRRCRSRASPSGSAKAMIVAASPLDMGGTTRGEADAASELEREIMNSRLYGAGFWRSASSGSAASSRCSSARR